MKPRRLAFGLAALLSGCAYLRPARVPMSFERHPGGPDTQRLVLLLPGRGDASADFARRGFVRMARQAGISADIVAADASISYYLTRSVTDRLEADLFARPDAARYRETFVAGISLGGLGAMILARDHPSRVQGLLAIAPYLGPDGLLAEIENAGGLAAWSPRRDGDFEGLWTWLKGYATGAERPALFLAFGESDRYARGHRLLARSLPAGQAFTEKGGHDWDTWRRLWAHAVRPGSVPGLGRE